MLLPVIRELGTRHAGPWPAATSITARSGPRCCGRWSTRWRAEFTPEVKSAWIKTYGVLSQTMREAALAHKAA